MLFQHLKGRYILEDGRILDHADDSVCNVTWNYADELNDDSVEYVRFYVHGDSIEKHAPEESLDEYIEKRQDLMAHIRSMEKIGGNEISLWNLIPARIFREFALSKIDICRHVFEDHDRPDNYDFYVDLMSLINDISQRELNIESGEYEKRVCYKPFSSRTGRLSTAPDSFPIMTLETDKRSIVKPQNDYFVGFDYNAAELRTFLSLSGHEQPKCDLHEWNKKNFFGVNCTRQQAKKKFFQWLFGTEIENQKIEKVYDKETVLGKYYTGDTVLNEYSREIKGVDKDKAMSYIIQSTFADLFLRKAIEINDFLDESSSYLSFMIHDSITVDLDNNDSHKLDDIKAKLESTPLGNFPVEVKVGSNFGNMKAI